LTSYRITFYFGNLCHITYPYCRGLSDLDISYLSLMDLGEAAAKPAIFC